MYVTEDGSTPSESGYTTPPLSPTKTISTEGWSSPRTPGSPRKSRSCVFFRNIDHELEDPFFTPPSSPTKAKFAARLGDLSTPEALRPATCDPISPILTDDSPEKRLVPLLRCPSPRRPSYLARSLNRSLPTATDRYEPAVSQHIPSPCSTRERSGGSICKRRKRSQRSSSESSIDALVAKYATPPTPPVQLRDDIQSPVAFDSPTKLRQLTRSSSSPLRSSQWVSRGGLLASPRKSQTSIPDRFIHCRRPPAVTRESFELNKPNEREQISRRGHRAGGDPFSRQVRRSDRLNAELRGLREAHTVIARRYTGSARSPNLRLRSSSLVMAARQISAGAVWNVGGPSAVSDTVAAISTGNGGMLGSGTNAPLYTSTFLNRADPEAEFEAYERRLALALEVDQTERVLHHSSLPSSRPGSRQQNTPPHEPHVWRDGAWTQDSVKPCLFRRLPNFCELAANKHPKLCDDRNKRPEDPCRSFPSDMSRSYSGWYFYIDVNSQCSTHPNYETTTTAPYLRTLTPPDALPLVSETWYISGQSEMVSTPLKH
jgi:hypothetical protein